MSDETKIFSTGNVIGDPLSTIAGFGVGAAQYGALNGLRLPQDAHDIQGWVSLGLWLLFTILGALGKMPQKGGAGAIVLALLLAAGQAHAFSTPTSAAAGEAVTGSCSGCTRATDSPSVATLTPGFRVPGTGGSFQVMTTIPLEATTPQVIVQFDVMRETVLDTKDLVCTLICLAAVQDGEDVSDADFTACAPASVDVTWPNPQWSTAKGSTILAITPKLADGSSCTGTACNGASLYMGITRLASGTCSFADGSSDSALYTWITPIFQ